MDPQGDIDGYHDAPNYIPGFLRPSRRITQVNRSVKLHQSENPWKPRHKDAKKVIKDPKSEVCSKLRSILNKLTPQNFQTLIKQVQGLAIDTETTLKGVTDIIFEKAICETLYSQAYANMCRYLLTLKVPSDTKKGETVNFRMVLLTRCQRQFEKDDDVHHKLDRMKKAIEEEESEEKKEKLKIELDAALTLDRKRHIGNARFMGELFKQKMLTENIMHDCVFKLLRSKAEENLESVCCLLTTIGKELETEKAKPRIDQYFQQMKKIIAEKKVSFKCQFMIQDVIDMRDSHWIPVRKQITPKTIYEIHKEAKVEEAMLTPLSMCEQAQRFKHSRSIHSKPGRINHPSGQDWTATNKAIQHRNIDVSKLRKEHQNSKDIQVGTERCIDGRNQVSSLKVSSALNHRDEAIAPGHSLSPIQDRTPGDDIPYSNQEQARERALTSARLLCGQTIFPFREESRKQDTTGEVELPALTVKKWSEEEIEEKTRSIIDEYLQKQDAETAMQFVLELNSHKTTNFFVYQAIYHVLWTSKQSRQHAGQLLHDLINQKVISVEKYLEGLTEVLKVANDMAPDTPNIWQYLGELIGPVIQDGCVPLSVLKTACDALKESGKAGNLMAEILHDASQRIGYKLVAHLWRNNCMNWAFFVPQEKIQLFLKEKQLEFTVSSCTTKSSSWIERTLAQLQNDKISDTDHIFALLEVNTPDGITKENRFIRVLMTAVCCSAIVGTGHMAKVDQEVIKKWRGLLLKYLDHQPAFELQALFALQALVHSEKHPSGMLRTFFDIFYNEKIISEVAFKEWEKSTEETEGKGIALQEVAHFLTWI